MELLNLYSQFIISESLSVASEEQPNSPCVLKGGVGMNILSAIFSVLGICVYIIDMCVNHKFPGKTSGFATSGVQLIFSLLELCVACTCAHFGCQLVSFDTMVYQTVYVSNQVPNPEPVNSPPSYFSEVQRSK